MKKGKQVGIWIRVSTEDQARGESPEHHEHRARKYADMKEWEVVTVYHLEAVSGKSVMEHSEARRMLADLKSGAITGIIFSKLARLARNTRQLLEFSDIFNQHGADLVSLQESIDTSTPAGRMFFTVQAALTQFEREEIAERVVASVPVRAELGKPLGGQAPFGYSWKGKELVLNEAEAPIRREMFEMFLKYKRRGAVAKALNEKGYRTRNGSKFTDTTIERLIRDTMAKGFRRANYTKSKGEKKHWELKPESEWVIVPCPAIVSEELWKQVNDVIDANHTKRKPMARRSVHPFSGTLECHCGGKMRVSPRGNKYACQKCDETRIAVEDIEDIYYQQLKGFLLGKDELPQFVERVDEAILKAKATHLGVSSEIQKVKSEMDKIMQLHLSGQIQADRFREYYSPYDERFRQLSATSENALAELDYLNVQRMNGDHILANAEDLYDKWPRMGSDEKRLKVEELTKSIIVGKEEIEITFSYTALSLNAQTSAHNPRDSY